MKNLVDRYLDRILNEVTAYKTGKNIIETKTETRKSYQKFLDEFYKTSYCSVLSSCYGKELFNFTLTLHDFIECMRRDFSRNIINEK